MVNNAALLISRPVIEVNKQVGSTEVVLRGCWNLNGLVSAREIGQKMQSYAGSDNIIWNLTEITSLDSAGAWIILRAWGRKRPLNVQMRPEHQSMFERWQNRRITMPEPPGINVGALFHYACRIIEAFWLHLLNWTELLGQLIIDALYLIKHPGKIPWAEISITIYDAGVRALSITALVGFLIGIVLSYLSALQLQAFGAEIYIINILGMSIIRELGPLLAAILVAGRSGSAMTAQIGIMRVTEELDALSAMGISHSLRLILPKVAALTVTLPLLTVWTDAAALLGGMLSAQHTLDISFQQFFLRLPDSVPLVNVFIGVGKAAVFGVLIALIACHFGFIIKPNTESLGNETTNSVVASITVVIMVDAVFAILFMHIGMP